MHYIDTCMVLFIDGYVTKQLRNPKDTKLQSTEIDAYVKAKQTSRLTSSTESFIN